MVITKDSDSFNPGSSPGRTFCLCTTPGFLFLARRAKSHVPVAQLDKASDYESEDWGFKSLQGYFFIFLNLVCGRFCIYSAVRTLADIAQLGERQTEDLKVPGSIPGVGTWHLGRVVKAID